MQWTTWERLTACSIIGAVEGDARVIRKAGKILDVLELSDKEKEEAGLVDVGGGSFRWQKESETALEIKDPDALVLLKERLSAFSHWTAAERKRVFALFAKLGIASDESPQAPA